MLLTLYVMLIILYITYVFHRINMNIRFSWDLLVYPMIWLVMAATLPMGNVLYGWGFNSINVLSITVLVLTMGIIQCVQVWVYGPLRDLIKDEFKISAEARTLFLTAFTLICIGVVVYTGFDLFTDPRLENGVFCMVNCS